MAAPNSTMLQRQTARKVDDAAKHPGSSRSVRITMSNSVNNSMSLTCCIVLLIFWSGACIPLMHLERGQDRTLQVASRKQ